MFIHYCDGCNVRVDKDESVTSGDKIYCKTCAEKQGLRAGGSGTHSGGGRASSSGAFGSSGAARRSPATGQRQVVVAARTASPRPGASQSRPSPVLHRTQADSSKVTMVSLAAAGIVLAAMGLFLMLRGKPQTADPADVGKTADTAKTSPIQPDKEKDKKTPQTGGESLNPGPAVTTKPDVKPPSPEPLKPKVAEAEIEDIREGAAARELGRIQEFEKNSASNPFEVRRRYERFVASYRSTKSGAAAAEHLKTLPPAQHRPPDAADRAEPGLQAKVYEKTFGGETIGGNNLKDCKFVSTKVVNEINMGNKGAIEGAFGRGDNTAIQFTGFVEVPADGTYHFYTSSDDGSLLYIGDTLLANNDGSHGMNEVGDSFPLKKGKHRLRIDYCQGAGEAGIIVSWSGPNLTKQVIPAAVLSHNNE